MSDSEMPIFNVASTFDVFLLCRAAGHMNSISTALSSIQADGARLDNAVNNIANLNTPGYRAQEPVQSGGEAGVEVVFSYIGSSPNRETSNVDLASQSVELITDRQSVAFASAVIRTQDS